MWTIFGALADKKAEQSRRSAEKKNASLLDQWNEDMFRYQDESRGSTGQNAMLLRNPELEGAETMFSKDAMDWYRSASDYYGSPADRLARFEQAGAGVKAAQSGAVNAVNNLFSGQLTQDRLAGAQPVMQARTDLAGTNRQGFLDALQGRLNALGSDDRSKGYSGTGSFAQNRLLGATTGANQMAAAVEAQAALENAREAQTIADDTRQMQIQNVNMPFQMQDAMVGLESVPMQAAMQSLMAQQAPFANLRTGYIAPPYGSLKGPLMRQPKRTGAQIAYEGMHESTNDVIDLALTAASMYMGGGMGGGMANFSDNKAPSANAQPQEYNLSNYGGNSNYASMGGGAPSGTTTFGGSSYAPGSAPAWGGW